MNIGFPDSVLSNPWFPLLSSVQIVWRKQKKREAITLQNSKQKETKETKFQSLCSLRYLLFKFLLNRLDSWFSSLSSVFKLLSCTHCLRKRTGSAERSLAQPSKFIGIKAPA